jgi:ketosteroid isomerase-like protein
VPKKCFRALADIFERNFLMKKVGFAARLLAVIAVLSLAAFAVAGCGSDKKDDSSANSNTNTSTPADSGSTGDSGDSAADSAANDVQSSGSANKSDTVVTDIDGDLTADEKAVIAAVGAFADATSNHDYKKICNDYLTKASQKIGAQTGNATTDCAAFFKKQGDTIKTFKITVNKVDVSKDGKSATVDGTSSVNGAKTPSQPIALKNVNGEWRIALLGN